MVNILQDTRFLFKKMQLWKLCENTVDHGSRQNYVKWNYLHNREFEELCQENNASCKSLYVPGESNIIIKGKYVLTGAGIKSLVHIHIYVMCAGVKELI